MDSQEISLTPVEQLQAFDEKNSPAGLFHRYAKGRVREFWARQVVTLCGAAVLGLMIAPIFGVLALTITVFFEQLDCIYLKSRLKRGLTAFEQPSTHRGALFFSIMQSVSIMGCMGMGWVFGGDEFRFFVLAFFAGACLNAGITYRYHPKIATSKFIIFTVGAILLITYSAIRAGGVSQALVLDVLAAAMMSYIVYVFLRFINYMQNSSAEAARNRLQTNVDMQAETDRAEEHARNSRMLARVASHSNDAISIRDETGEILWVNQTFGSIFAASSETIVGQNFDEIFCDDTADIATVENIRDALKYRRSLRYQMRNLTSSGIPIWTDNSLTPLPAEEGEQQKYLFVARDITAQKASDREIRKLAQVVRENSDGIFFVDQSGKITWANKTICQVLSRSFREMMDQPLGAVLNLGSQSTSINKQIKQSIKSGEPTKFEVHQRTDTNEPLWFEATITPLSGHDETVKDLVVAIHDVTAQRLHEAKLQRLAALAKYSNDAISFRTPDGRISWVNETFERTFGYSAEEAVGKIGYKLLAAPGVPQSLMKMLRDSFKRSEAFRFEGEAKCKDGSIVWIDYSVTPIHDQKGNIVNYIYVGRDVSEARAQAERLEQAKQAAEEATRAKSTFLATMSHEIRTPMNGIIGMSDLLLKTPLKNEQKEYVQTIVSSGEALLQIINDILDFSKLDAGKLTVTSHPFDLRRTLASSLTILEPIAKEKGIYLTHEVGDDVPATLMGDEGRVRQIIINLVGNGLKFTSKGGVHVTCNTVEKDGKQEVRLDIADTGIGIPEDAQAKIFETFSQADGDTTRKFGGTGLGLSICKLLSKQMGGDVTVSSVPDKGSTFSVTMLMDEAIGEVLETETQRRAKDAENARLDGLRVLVAEDNKTNRLLIRKMLSKTGARIEFAADGIEAVDMFETQEPHVMFMDVSMPHKNGLEATLDIRMIEAEKGLHPVPIVALTANAFAEDQQKCLDAGMDAFLSKPIKKHQLIGQILTLFPELPEEKLRSAS